MGHVKPLLECQDDMELDIVMIAKDLLKKKLADLDLANLEMKAQNMKRMFSDLGFN